MSQHGVGLRAVMRSAAFLTAGALAVPALAGCGSPDPAGKPLAGPDTAPAARDRIADGGTLRWAVDAVPETLNAFQADADAGTTRVAQAVLPSLYRMGERGRPEINPDYLESAKIVDTEPQQVVLYKLNQQAVWSDGREIGAADFAAQWRALSGRDSAYWTARNAGYERIERIERGASDLEVKVTFKRSYADWKSLFSPLYPKEVMGSPDAFNEGARRALKLTAGPFVLKKVDRADDEVRLARNPRWWGRPAKLSGIVLREVPREKRAAALTAGRVDVAEIDAATAGRLAPHEGTVEVRKSLEPAFTQLALNGAGGPLADERVRRAVARALDRRELARVVLEPLGLPAKPVGSHVALSGQAAYADGSGALGGQDTKEARALLADAGWEPGTVTEKEKKEKKDKDKGEKAAGPKKDDDGSEEADDGTYIVGEDDKARGDDEELAQDGKQHLKQGGAPGAYAPKGTAAPARSAPGPLAKDGKALSLRFVLPSGPGSKTLATVAERIRRMLDRVGIRTEVSKVEEEGYFKDHIASGEYDLALYSWPTSAFPATDARPIYAKPVPAADGSLNVEQNYTRVGTDQVDQLFEQAVGTLDEGESRALLRKADARIWAAAGSLPLYQRPQLVAARSGLANVGAFGFGTPVYEDMGFLKKEPGSPSGKASTSASASRS
ncbi:ABC transporter family substrate-binding protein [Streptomyces flavalbus]|uniref:ABC transporter family substrate-binding protein n=1 Tax=Streptomyces flavalbus TaxID=2665155 RepID=A0ABW2WG81_9ACTN